MLPLVKVLQNNNVADHLYEDDTQIYVALSQNDFAPTDSLTGCTEQKPDASELFTIE